MLIYYVMYYFWSNKKFTPTVKPLALQKNGRSLRSLRCYKNTRVLGSGALDWGLWAPGLPKQTRGIFHMSLFALGTLKSGDAFNFQRNLPVHCPKNDAAILQNSIDRAICGRSMCQGSSCKGSCTRGWLNRAPRVNSWDFIHRVTWFFMSLPGKNFPPTWSHKTQSHRKETLQTSNLILFTSKAR